MQNSIRFTTACLLILLSGLWFVPLSQAATKRALLIGIDKYQNLPHFSPKLHRDVTNLKGAVNDIIRIKEKLVSHFGFSEEQIMTLTNVQATKANILSTIDNWLIKGTKPGDFVFFYFSGYGSQISLQTSDEIAPSDQTFCAHEVKMRGNPEQLRAGMIVDSELRAIFGNLEGRTVRAYLDAGRSGTTSRSVKGRPVSDLEATPAYVTKYLAVETIENQSGHGRRVLPEMPSQCGTPSDHVFLYACGDDELAVELTMPDGNSYGALTLGILDAFDSEPNGTYRAFFGHVRDYIKNNLKLVQTPRVQPSHDFILSKPVFPTMGTSDTKAFTLAVPEAGSDHIAELQTGAVSRVDTRSSEPDWAAVAAFRSLPSSQAEVQTLQIPPLSRFTERELQTLKSAAEVGKTASEYASLRYTKYTATTKSLINKGILLADPDSTGYRLSQTGIAVVEKLSRDRDDRVLLRIDRVKGASAEAMSKIEQGLARFDFVKLTKQNFFDRILRGEMDKDVFKIRLVSRTGDVVPIAHTRNADEIVRDIERLIENDYVVKQMARIHNPKPSFKVDMRVADGQRNDFRLGEKIVFSFRADEDCYVYIFNIDSQGSVNLIFPNSYCRDNFVRRGEERKIPDERMGKKFELEFGEPAGEETVKVIATKEPLDINSLNMGQFEHLFQKMTFVTFKERTRSILIKEVNERLSGSKLPWADDTVVVRTHAK